MGNTPSNTEGIEPPTAEEMREAEDACAACKSPCEIVHQYPDNIAAKIDRDFVLHNSGKLHRWHVVLASGMPASKWPRDPCEGKTYAAAVNAVTSTYDAKMRISVIPRSPDAHCNPEEATDIYIFPEFVVYRSVDRNHIQAVFDYHVNVVAPRHQAEALNRLNSTEHPLPTPPEYTQDQLDAIALCKPPSSDFSHFIRDYDRVEYSVGTKFPHPIDIKQHTWVLLCGHTIRDKRCGVTAPIIREQINHVLEQKHPHEIDNIDIELVSHVGGHKVAGNVIIISKSIGSVFYGRVFPEHIENIVSKTIIGGQILEPIARACHGEIW